MKVKPAEGRAVRDPALRDLLPAEGRDVPCDDYWLRRLRDGDVVEEARKATASDKRETP
ncbi:DUF2635 domain-containing protein [Roseomonas sp. USHLN139]|uniref:DUF2635 domain-containing protein n=1 Tax=Roseomonas sp. USHLN139 TaxID=3081298 RepID=UPI003B023037